MAETALRRGNPAVVVEDPEDLKPADLAGSRVVITAGAFALDETIRTMAVAITRG